MGDVLEFPSQQTKGLAFLDREIRQLLLTKGADDELMDFAAQQLKKIYSRIKDSEQYCFSIRLPEGLNADQQADLQADIEAGLEGVRKDNHRLLVELVAELVLAEVKGFQLARR
ncbi:hypothetical protein [Pseudohalioglobus lutimaris]|uniref:Uncharacterized protein n=1 Tax=Pseudohalioglobus lutimaris TaxID=1737061 RepID=A0A2N5X097_9GAMM|nr:hypothetical protein [Pseudohalioglobus lutimaris]PLW67898.1 hypothetical protein C0039_14750 [Pseudohalioglobus lutimaris]